MPSTRAARAVVVDGGGQVNLARKHGLGNNGAMQRMAKRKAEEVASDARGSRGKKRAALGEITNAFQERTTHAKKGLTKILNKSRSKLLTAGEPALATAATKKPSVAATKLRKAQSATEPALRELEAVLVSLPTSTSTSSNSLPASQTIPRPIEESGEDDEEFVSALEEDLGVDESDSVAEAAASVEIVKLPEGVYDFDATVKDDPHQGTTYVVDTFNYYRNREEEFRVPNYMSKMQRDITMSMRGILVDWMVEVQESFELNHETLYTGVKLVDMYLSRVKGVPKTQLQLCGATALLIACKIDERIPPLLDDFVYVCDDAYSKEDIVKREIEMIAIAEYDFGFPLSYRFLRRYGRVCRASMPVLTFARYILELSLMEYDLNVETSESMLATAVMYIALKIWGHEHKWEKTLEYFSGYKLETVSDLVARVHQMLLSPSHESRHTIKTKYSHSVFHKVALTEIPKVL